MRAGLPAQREGQAELRWRSGLMPRCIDLNGPVAQRRSGFTSQWEISKFSAHPTVQQQQQQQQQQLGGDQSELLSVRSCRLSHRAELETQRRGFRKTNPTSFPALHGCSNNRAQSVRVRHKARAIRTGAARSRSCSCSSVPERSITLLDSRAVQGELGWVANPTEGGVSTAKEVSPC
ncbi:hypothetical protein INR49_032756 [Caranx melampygus]|nr:hypothetical protein INR49_032756 [Caranx melampygus]